MSALLLAASVSSGWATNQIPWYVIGSGGGSATSSSYQVAATIGQSVVGQANSTNYRISAGFWFGSLGTPTDVGGEQPAGVAATVPLMFQLNQNVPNPFNPRTSIAFSLAKPARTTVRIFDLGGRLVATLVDGELVAGAHRVEWDGRNDQGRQVASGTYYYQLRSGDSGATGRMSLIK
jgi:hypothetical protein